MKAKDNKWLIVLPTVILTPTIEPIIVKLDKYFEEAKLKAYVTSGLRSSEDQLRVIRSYLKKKELDIKYPEAMSCGLNEKHPDGTYVWQLGWSALLNSGLIINPPLKAQVLMNYIRNGINKKGQVINQTPHSTGTALDIGGGANGIHDELAVLTKAHKDLKFKQLLAEHDNNCVHIGIYS